MEVTIENIFLGFFLLVTVIYSLLIFYFTFSWIRLQIWNPEKSSYKTKVSVVIPVRNESSNIIRCLESITSQDYPAELFEIIVCDDSSTDDTVAVVKKYIKQTKHSIRLIELSLKKLLFKKQAITEAVSAATGQLIMVTDGDCIMNSKWISSFVSYYEEKQSAIIAGPVFFSDEKGIFSKLQSLEFMSLVASGMGSVSGNFPVMCNGANLAYTKEAFISSGGYSSDSGYASGDDIFLLLKIRNLFPGKTGVIKSAETIVYTNAPKNLKHFIAQRIRWVSKSRGYRSFPAIFTSVTVYLTNFLIFLSGIFSFFNYKIFMVFIVIFLFKCIVDLPVLASITGFAKKRNLLIYFFPLQIFYVIYVSLMGIAGNMATSTWKGRKIK